MKTVNTIENKVKFFAMYLKSADVTVEFKSNELFNYTKKLSYYHLGCIESGWQGFVGGYVPNIKNAYLELTPLYQISDDDKEYLGLSNAVSFDEYGYNYPIGGECWNNYEIDYLRSKGYAVQWLAETVNTLINYGWVKLKEATPC